MTEMLDTLERLARLHQSGALTDAEFAEQKARVLQGEGTSRAVRHDRHDSGTERDGGGGWLLVAGLAAVLLGVLLWWQLVDGNGEVKPVPGPGSTAATQTAVKVDESETVRPPARTAATDSADAPLVVETGTAPMPATYNPSFECVGQDEPTLVMICESPALSRKDRELSDRFKAVLRSLDEGDRDDLLRQQRGYLRERSACTDTACLEQWYDRTLAIYADG